MIEYPKVLEKIFDKLKNSDIKPIIVGGYIRDKLLNLDSKDIDIELYNLDSLDILENILSEFGTLNSVGKSFGVCKLKYKDLDLDFSLPRVDNKTQSGHRGFSITTFKNLDFKTAASRRDFTINAIGYDVISQTLLDPYHGIGDLSAKVLRAVSIEKFDEDPLRVLRAIQFSSRFDFRLDDTLFQKCKDMIDENQLKELASERIYEECKKMLLKSKTPSKGFTLLKNLGGFSFFQEFQSLSDKSFSYTLKTLDFLQSLSIKDEKKELLLSLALLCREFSPERIDSFLSRLTNESTLFRDVKTVVALFNSFEIEHCNNYELYTLAQKFELKSFFFFAQAAFLGNKKADIQRCKKAAKELKIYTKPMAAFIQGRDLISMGMRPSKEFSQLLFKIYEAQKKELFSTKEEAIIWVRENLLS